MNTETLENSAVAKR